MKFTGKNILVVLGLTTMFLIFIYLALFVLIRPIGGMIVEDNPVLQTFCNMQAHCEISNLSFKCGYKDIDLHKKKLERLASYNGCNQSTSTYYEIKDSKYVRYVSCSCGGLQ